MFVPRSNTVNNVEEIQRFIREYSFGVLVTNDKANNTENTYNNDNNNTGRIIGTHLPFTLEATENENGVLVGHIAKANPQWKCIENQEVLVIFTGPHAYVSPTWYTQKPNVPTWNYTTVHAYGQVSLLTKSELLQSLHTLTAHYEPSLLEDTATMSEAYINKLIGAIVGIKIDITRLEAQMKLGQQRSKEDQQGIFEGLLRSRDPQAVALAELMQKIVF